MNISELNRKFNTQSKCIAHLEKVRWGNKPVCPYCKESEHIADRGNEYRYQCNACGNSFSVLVDTIFEDTKMPLQTINVWLIINQRKMSRN